jgi:hypothetical protein
MLFLCHAIKMYGVGVKLHTLLAGVISKVHTPSALLPMETDLGAYWTGGCVIPREDPD